MLSLFLGTVVVIMLLLVIVVVSKEYHASNHRARQELAYPDKVPGPPSKTVVNGVDTAMLQQHIHDEADALNTVMKSHSDFASTIDLHNLSMGTSGPDSGFPGLEEKRSHTFSD